MPISDQVVELRVGDSIWLGQYQVTIVEVEEGEVTFRIDDSAVNRRTEIRTLPR